MRRICLVTPSHPSSNPRLVKEAAALHTAGYAVHVVASRYFPPLDPFDNAIYAAAPWSRTVVDFTSGPVTFARRLRRRLARRLVSAGLPPSLRLAAWVQHPAIGPLAAAAARQPADLYIGHCLAGLAAAGLAAARTGARLGFDAEDFHPAETTDAEQDPVEIATIRRLEAAWLPRCVHLTAAAPLIGRAYRDAYGLPRDPATVLNVFPLSEAPSSPVAPERPSGLPLLYWFSQTIGPGRGLEALLSALGRLRTPCALRLRGLPAPGFPDALRAVARDAGFTGPLDFAPLGPPDRMLHLAAGADLGLSLEQSTPRNRDLCLTNKIFTYLLAGVPVALTPTRAQSALLPELGPAALPLNLADPAAAASVLDAFLGSPARLAAARDAAWQLGRTRYHWDLEQRALLSSVASALSP